MRCGRAGSRTSDVACLARSITVATTVPPWSSTRRRTNGRPTPRPASLVTIERVALMNRSKTCPAFVGSMPMPSSRPVTTASLLPWAISRSRPRARFAPSGMFLDALLRDRHDLFEPPDSRYVQRLERHRHVQPLFLRLHAGFVLLAHAAQYYREMGGFGSRLDLRKRHAGHIQQVIDQPRHVMYLALHDLEHPLLLFLSHGRLVGDGTTLRRARAGCAARGRTSRGTRPCADRPSRDVRSGRLAPTPCVR